MTPWQPIDTAPFSSPFLARDKRGEVKRCWRHRPSSRTDEILGWDRCKVFKATHWMPMPPPPAENTAADNCAGEASQSALSEQEAIPLPSTQPEAEPSGGWRAIESAPINKTVLVYCERFKEVCEARNYCRDGWLTLGVNGPMTCRPRVWQPLPPPPEEPGGEGRSVPNKQNYDGKEEG